MSADMRDGFKGGRMTRLAIIVLSLALFTAATAWGSGFDDAKRCYEETNNDMKLHYCSRAISSGELSDDNLAATFNNRGNAYRTKGDTDRAIQDYDQAIRLKPDYAEAFNSRGVLRFDQGMFSEAITDLEKAVQLKPTNKYFAIYLFLAQSRARRNSKDHVRINA